MKRLKEARLQIRQPIGILERLVRHGENSRDDVVQRIVKDMSQKMDHALQEYPKCTRCSGMEKVLSEDEPMTADSSTQWVRINVNCKGSSSTPCPDQEQAGRPPTWTELLNTPGMRSEDRVGAVRSPFRSTWTTADTIEAEAARIKELLREVKPVLPPPPPPKLEPELEGAELEALEDLCNPARPTTVCDEVW